MRPEYTHAALAPHLDKWLARVQVGPGCWEWTGAISSAGYATLTPRLNLHYYGHRFAFAFFYGGIPGGLSIDHRCENTRCVRPSHLRLMRIGDNVRASSKHPSHQTACARGHPFDEANTGWQQGRYGLQRYCKTCRRASSLRRGWR